MPSHLRRQAFTLPELIVVLLVLAVLLPLGVMALRSTRENSRRNSCTDKLREIGAAFRIYDSRFRRYPSACTFLSTGWLQSDPARDCRAGDASGGKNTTGCSIHVFSLPMLEETNLYNALSQATQRFTISTGPFTPRVTNPAAAYQHVSCVPLSQFVCPAWDGDGYTNLQMTVDIGPACGVPTGYGAPEYARVDSDIPGSGTQAFKGKVAVTNYKPMVGTHMKNGVPVGNGGIAVGPQGFTSNSIKDGLSNTIFFAETRESSYASWYDGTLNWLVANDPNKPAPGASSSPDGPPWTNGSVALNRGYDPKTPGSVPYLKKTATANSPLNDVWCGE